MIVGTETSDDAGVYRLNDDLAIINTVDFFTPIVNDPFSFGRIAAANSFSDIYAMGGRPITAMNIVCFPIKDMDKSILKAILHGGLEIIHETGAVMAGGHSVEDPEMKYGLSVTGIVHPDHFISNERARPGDVLVLTKPIGTGILTTALKGGVLNDKVTAEITELMATLNKGASEAMAEVGGNAATDITGFGLIGHALEMAKASKIGIRLNAADVPVISEAMTFASMGMVPEGSHRNRNFCSHEIHLSPQVDPLIIDLLTDAQTSGGLLISVPGGKADLLLQKLIERNTPCAKVVGEVVSKPKKIIQVV